MILPISVTQNELLEMLLNIAPVRPVFIWGAPGIGKSAIVEQFAKEVGMPCVSLLGSQLAPEDIKGRVEVKGRGGTVLQPRVDVLEQAKDFPQDGPILIITDGMIESSLKVRREHAFLMPNGKRLPFQSKVRVFRME